MTKNIGRFDQVLRIIISLGLIYIGFVDKGLIADSLTSNIVGVVGGLNLIVALIRTCPLYSIAGINTCPKADR